MTTGGGENGYHMGSYGETPQIWRRAIRASVGSLLRISSMASNGRTTRASRTVIFFFCGWIRYGNATSIPLL